MTVEVVYLRCYIANCRETCDDKQALWKHFRDRHRLKRFLCHSITPEVCGRSYNKMYDLERHAKLRHGKVWQCPYPARGAPGKKCTKVLNFSFLPSIPSLFLTLVIKHPIKDLFVSVLQPRSASPTPHRNSL